MTKTQVEDNDFLPADYEPPKSSSKYTKFEDGKTIRIRVLSSPILGWEYWEKTSKDAKPVRLPYNEESYKLAVKEANKNEKKDDKKVNHFWIMKVWNYETKTIEVCEITQKTIHASIRNLTADSDFKNPLDYDLKITKKKENERTTYEVAPWVPKPITDEIKQESDEVVVNLRALFYGADPFDTDWVEAFTE